MDIEFEAIASQGSARAGTITTPRGVIETPVFMPVGTRGAIKTIDTSDIEKLDASIILGNTYHLMERPGADLIADLGGLHKFMDWGGHMLTDSGGFQVFSLKPKISEEGVIFKSVYDGSLVEMTPESSMDIQQKLGADIAMVFDVCSALPATHDSLKADMEMTLRWAQRCKDSHTNKHQALFGICQGGVDLGLRTESAARTIEIGFDGYAIGGLSVGESRDEMVPALQAAVKELPLNKPRYFMGLGDPIGLLEAVTNGVDMFDCVLPTRLARHGTALTSQGRINLKNAKFANDDSSIDNSISNGWSERYSKAYIRHLLVTNEPTAGRILTMHNLFWLKDFVSQIRNAVLKGELDNFRAEVYDIWK